MSLMSFYILIWPVVSAGILALLIISLVRDIRQSKANGTEMI